MNIDTGKINEFSEIPKSEIHRYTPLTHQEFLLLKDVDESNRALVLARHRWVENRRQRGIPTDVTQKNAFSQGFRAAKTGEVT